jgi:cytochrome P450
MRCDDSCDFDPFSEAYDRDPHPTLRHLRECHRVYHWEKMDAWLLTHHADVDWLLKQAPVSTNDIHWEKASPTGTGSSWDRLRHETITFKEGAEHLRLRRYVSGTFTPAAVQRLVPQLRELVRSALRDAGESGAEFDLARDLSSRIPIQILGVLMGVPSEMEPDFCRFAVHLQNVINPLSDAAAKREADAAASGFYSMLGDIIDRVTARPGDDLMSALVHHEAGEGRLERDALIGIATSIIMAGAETTGSLVNHGVLALLAHPERLEELRTHPERLPGAIDELGRFEFPTKFVTRYPLEDIEVAGQTIRKGSLVFGSPGAANRDPAVFEDPDRLDFSRPLGASLTFGAGAYFCLGASLARLEAQEMIGQLLQHFPELELAGAPEFTPHFNIRLIRSLPLHTGPARDLIAMEVTK